MSLDREEEMVVCEEEDGWCTSTMRRAAGVRGTPVRTGWEGWSYNLQRAHNDDKKWDQSEGQNASKYEIQSSESE